MSQTQLRVTDLTMTFGGFNAVETVSFEVSRGKVHSIIGPNGAGKTTLLNMLSGVYAPTAGRIELEDQDITALAPHALAACGLSRTFQNLQIFFNMSAIENVMLGRHLLENRGWLAAMLRLPGMAAGEHASRSEAAELMHFVGLDDYLDADSDAMPYGALRRLEIARALASRPKVLLLDEPAAGLNATETQDINRLIGKLADAGITVILVEHDMQLVMDVSDHIVVLNYGRKLCEGTAHAVRNDPRVIEAYLGSEDLVPC